MKRTYIVILIFLSCSIYAQKKKIYGKLKLAPCENEGNLYNCSYNYLGKLFEEKLSEKTITDFLDYKKNPDTLKLGINFIVNEQGKPDRKLLNTEFNSLANANDTIYDILKNNVSFIMPLNECSMAVKGSLPRLELQYKVIRSDNNKIRIVLIPPLSKEERKKKATRSYLGAVPKFCKEVKSSKERRDCLSNFTKKHIAKNFKTKLIKKEGLMCTYRLYAKIRIDKNGVVDRVLVSENKYKTLEEEIVRVIKSLPKVMPGIKDGNPKSVLYTIPIVIK